ncbi:hypothetical protein WMY93_014899 [Mugilogobius chulae]|uniref:B30.2/SPRY domain-containing protein n=1 Tax=Mugilogobius chulae TaxID=88201 RepID=A0AAW0P032_9GOBI
MSCEEEASGLAVPSAGGQSVLQGAMSLTPLDSTEDRVQPFPRSPELQRKLAKAAVPTKEQLSKKMEELKVEKVKTEARIQSLRKRKADLTARTEAMKAQIHARFEAMRVVLRQEEQAATELLELDLKKTRTKLDQVVKACCQHLYEITNTISSTEKALGDKPRASPGGEMEAKKENISFRKSDRPEMNIRLNEERYDKLVQMLSNICKHLRAQLQRKTLLLDLLPVVVDTQTCHRQLTVTSDGSRVFYVSACSSPEHPLQFDRMCCALGSAPLTSGHSYFEVDVRCCCSRWAVGVAFGLMARKGADGACKLGRNNNSWCVELKNEQLSAWHDNRQVTCQRAGRARLKRVGVWVQFDKGQLVFYDADTMGVLQSFSAAMMEFDRVHRKFREPLYPAVRFIKPDAQLWPNHMEFCRSQFSF